jgi:hypothetical protein
MGLRHVRRPNPFAILSLGRGYVKRDGFILTYLWAHGKEIEPLM